MFLKFFYLFVGVLTLASAQSVKVTDLPVMTFTPYDPTNLPVECEGECDLPYKIGCMNYGRVSHANQWVCESLINAKPLKVERMTIRCESTNKASCTLVIKTKPAPLVPSWLKQMVLCVPSLCIVIWGSERTTLWIYFLGMLWVLAWMIPALSYNPRVFTHLTYT